MCGRYYASSTRDRILVTEMCPGFNVYFSSKEKPLETKILFDLLTHLMDKSVLDNSQSFPNILLKLSFSCTQVNYFQCFLCLRLSLFQALHTQ